MADVKWIKIVTDIFDDEKILLIESLPDADTIIVIWFKLLCLAGKTNNGGVLLVNDRIHYTDEMLATIFRRPLNTVKLALSTFEQYGMIEIINDTITIPNWEKHQNADGLEKIREQTRVRVALYRQKNKQLADATPCNVTGNVTVTQCNATDKDKNKNKNKNKNIYSAIIDCFNDTCVSFPRVTAVSERRIRAISARLKQYSVEDFKTLFEKTEASDFLKGKNNKDWHATFDWLMCDSNFAKTLDGNYDNRKSSGIAGEGETNNIFLQMLAEENAEERHS